MTRPVVLQPPASVDRRQPLLGASGRGRKPRLGEVAGGTAAECAAVCCCCPCALLKLLVLGLYKLPAGICRRARRRKRRRRMLEAGLLPPRGCGGGGGGGGVDFPAMDAGEDVGTEGREAADELDREMMERFYSGGFWRSSSRRNEVEAQ
ncbi:Unknown protein [Striga hermonthica]|uniref:Uncharacterized protein n=1 Tax=Striga hermonthica TaxID=68872 RepID=A0A9N7RA63_STRHE|nr:Unknown protein [Striga hermonthica]